MSYTNNAPIMSDHPYTYDGAHDPKETVCTIKWCVQDVLDLMARRGVVLNDRNLDKLLDSSLGKNLKDRSTEHGWEVLDDLIGLYI